VWIESCR